MRGFTLIELLLVIALILLLGGLGSPFISRFYINAQYETSVDKVISTLRKAQTYAMSGKNNAVWGICYTSNMVRLYQGTCASPTFAENFDISSNITITGLSSETTFSLGRGEPSQALTITISSLVGTTTVTLNRAGGMNVQ
jgi:prepilin-type N-terminal cleavage/methylation domain-containing protein